jgi:ribonuclease J
MGKATEQIMRAAADFVPPPFAPTASQYLESGKPLQIGPFAITPYLVDHSGFDAYALEIEAGNRRLSIPATCGRTAARASCLSA